MLEESGRPEAASSSQRTLRDAAASYFLSNFSRAAEEASRLGIELSWFPSEEMPTVAHSDKATDHIAVNIEDHYIGTVIATYDSGQSHALGLIRVLLNTAEKAVATQLREERLLEELSTSWESLEALYEVNSNLRGVTSEGNVLETLLRRATPSEEYRAALWVLENDRFSLTAQCGSGIVPTPRTVLAGYRTTLVLNGREQIQEICKDEDGFGSASAVTLIPVSTRRGLEGLLAVWTKEEALEFDSYLVRLLEALSFQAAMVIESERLNRAFLERERLRREIEIGYSIQQSLLFGQVPSNLAGLRMAAFTAPSQRIDGDFYDFLEHADGTVDVVVGDVMGKGVAAALLGAAIKASILHAVADLGPGASAAEVVRTVHHRIAKQLISLETFVTLCYARLYPATNRLDIVDCGHPRVIHYQAASGSCRLLEGRNTPLGFNPSETYEQITTTYAAGDSLFIYSDGITDTRDGAGEFYGEERLIESVIANASLPPGKMLEQIGAEVRAFAGPTVPGDDCTAVVIRATGSMEARWDSHLTELSHVRRWVKQCCRPLNLPDEHWEWELELAAAEAFANIVKHGYEECPGKSVDGSFAVSGRDILLELRHDGEPFDPEQVPEPSFDGSRDHGFGIFLIHSVVDAVRYHSPTPGVQAIEMRKSLPGNSKETQ